MTDEKDIIGKLSAQLLKMVPPKKRSLSITQETEIFRDLGLYGDDLFELLMWIEREFGLKPNPDLLSYAPREAPFHGVLQIARRTFLRSKEYRSFTVGDIVKSVQAKRCSDELQ